MGVQGLWRLLESTGKPVNPETLEGKTLAVDISIWLNQAVKGVRDREGNSVQNAHLLTLFNRICKLLFFRIRPVFVFDGDAPLLKKQTLALRRQRKEELSRESKQTNEKLLRTFLKRQAIKAALGDNSKDPLPSLSSVRRNEVDDMYVLPALPAAEEKNETSSEEEEEGDWDEMVDTYHSHQGEVYEDPNSVDINSEDFASLPPEMKHEILKDMKEFSKRRRTMYHKPPEHSGDFSQYQLAGLLQRNQLNQRLEGVEKEMSQRSAGSAPQLYEQDGDQQSHSVESHRLVSEDNSHYILIKGSKKRSTASESQPAAEPWSGSSLSGYKKRAADRPEPLWRPVCEEQEEKVWGTSSEDSKPSVSKQSPGETSPRTLKAIQAVINDSSDEEAVNQDKRDGSVSPRTQLAIQQALAEDEDGAETLISSSPTKLCANTHHLVPQVVISSSDEETEPDDLKSSSNEKSDFKGNLTNQIVNRKDLFVNSSEDEMEEVIGQRNKALRFAALQQSHEKEQTTEDETKKGQLTEDITAGSGGHTETEQLKNREPEHRLIRENGDLVQSQSAAASCPNTLCISVSAERKTESPHSGPEQRSNESPNVLEQRNGDDNEETELEEETESSSAPAINEWEHLDMEELEALESSLRVEQSNLREQKQQQERMANTVTGQMYLESQELLRLFGVPYLVAPMEAEAQCAALDRADQTNGTITDDSDVWLFGGRHVYKNFFSQNKYVEHYQYSDLQNQLGLDRTKLINLAYLLGSDYTEGVPEVGYVTGMEILNEFPGPGLEPLIEFSKWWADTQEKKRLVADPRDTKVKKKLRNLKLQPGFPNPAVAQAYLHPAVEQSDCSFSWGRPQLDMIKEYPFDLSVRFGWSSRKTEETLQPVIKQLNTQQTQLRIDSFFRMEQQEKQTIRSQRLRRAVTCLKRKEREGRRRGRGRKIARKKSKAAPLSTKTEPPAVKSSSSSGEDSDGGVEVAMVTARSVFESSRRGRGAKSTRGGVRGGQRGRRKKL
uniref:Excision repair cross-complementation group 5 n=1 Tax=Anabas testudineus TaxID=64144 RepID=A0A7N6BYQ0_ANATE